MKRAALILIFAALAASGVHAQGEPIEPGQQNCAPVIFTVEASVTTFWLLDAQMLKTKQSGVVVLRCEYVAYETAASAPATIWRRMGAN